MAKDKQYEVKYKEEGRRRIERRKKIRLENFVHTYHENKSSKCSYCGGKRTWCSCCLVWSRSCCVEYGTCMCS